MAQFRRQDRQTIKKRAEAARQHEERSGGGGGDATWYKLDFGTTVLRVLPPFSDRGVIIKEVYEHGWLPPSATRGPSKGKGGARRATCLAKSFPEREVSCALCGALDEAEKKHRGSAKGFWPGRKCYVNALVIRHSDPQGNIKLSPDRTDGTRYKPYIVQLPQSVANWIEIQQDTNDMDFADVDGGINISVTKTRTGKEAIDVDYKPNTDVKGATPLVGAIDPAQMPEGVAPDADALLAWIAESMMDLDTIYGWPKDEKLADIAETAEILKGYLAHRASQTAAGAAGGSWQDGAASGGGSGGSDAVTKAYNEGAPAQPATPAKGGMAPPASLADAQKTGQPDCFGGAREHTGSQDEDYAGSRGFQGEYVKCIICEAEVSCRQACEEAGLIQVEG